MRVVFILGCNLKTFQGAILIELIEYNMSKQPSNCKEKKLQAIDKSQAARLDYSQMKN